MNDPHDNCPWRREEIWVKKDLARFEARLEKLDETLQEILIAVRVKDGRTKLWVAAIAAVGGTAGALIVALIGAI